MILSSLLSCLQCTPGSQLLCIVTHAGMGCDGTATFESFQFLWVTPHPYSYSNPDETHCSRSWTLVVVILWSVVGCPSVVSWLVCCISPGEVLSYNTMNILREFKMCISKKQRQLEEISYLTPTVWKSGRNKTMKGKRLVVVRIIGRDGQTGRA